MERFSLKKLNQIEGVEKYCVEVSNRFAALEDLDVEIEINTTWETMRENIKISAKESLGYYELKQHKPWFDERCSKLLDHRKQTAEPLVPGPSHLEVEISIAKLKKYKSLAELHQAGGETFVSVFHKLITTIWNKEEMPDQWKESIIVPIHKTGDKTDCNNYGGISLLSISYKILSNILLSRLSPYIDEIIGDHQFGF
jgi:hypothetical protein